MVRPMIDRLAADTALFTLFPAPQLECASNGRPTVAVSCGVLDATLLHHLTNDCLVGADSATSLRAVVASRHKGASASARGIATSTPSGSWRPTG